ncbi:hypothetical protein [Ramlibacter sp. PS4R-6]|uniref:hypothetical protein n=1 Tax=Ramlibacter sp. PS4R-6 TaxID=3133438 RepID=UPI0030B52762
MSLSMQSIHEVAKKRTRRARANVERAEAQLKSANETLEKAIPQGDTEQIEVAHIETKQAEEAVSKATGDLQVVETLLELEVAKADGPHEANGEGLKSLVRLLNRERKT